MTTDTAQTKLTNPLRILVVSSELPPGPGGIGSHAYDLSAALKNQGYNVWLLGSQHYCSPSERDSFNDQSLIPITTFEDAANPAQTAWCRLQQLLSAVDTTRPDVVLASGGRVLWLAALACKKRSVPWVSVVHGSELGGSSVSQRVTAWALRRSNRVVAVSQFTADLATANLDIPSTHVSVIHNGADGSRFSPSTSAGKDFRERYGLDNKALILTVGNVTERKGQHQVVASLPHLLKKVDAHYVVVGRPTNAEQLMEQATSLGVEDHISILGQLPPDEVERAHQSADVFAMTSTNTSTGDVEGYGIAAIEAALCGVPAVVTKGTGAEEAVVDGTTGLAVDSDPVSIANGLAELLSSNKLRHSMGKNARQNALESGTWDKRATAYSQLLDEVASGSKPRLVVVSHTEHYKTQDGTIVGFGPTLRELDQLATLTSELIHIAPLYPGSPPGMTLPYTNPRIRHVATPVAGGSTTKDRILALRVVPAWLRLINRELRNADAVHVRAPAGIAMVALVLLAIRRRPRNRWVKYAGNWMPDSPDAYTYRLQRWWLKKGLSRGPVTVNGRWDNQPPWVIAFDNPTLTDQELAAGAAASASRPPGPPFKAVFVGRLEKAKGAHIAAETVRELQQRGIDIELDLIGDGELRSWVANQISESGNETIRLQGWMTRQELEGYLSNAHIFLLPTVASEGFPKAVGEALAYGCVPFTTAVSAMGQTLSETGGAVIIKEGQDWADVLEDRLTSWDMAALGAQGVEAASRFSYRTYLGRVRNLAAQYWSVDL